MDTVGISVWKQGLCWLSIGQIRYWCKLPEEGNMGESNAEGCGPTKL